MKIIILFTKIYYNYDLNEGFKIQSTIQNHYSIPGEYATLVFYEYTNIVKKLFSNFD